MTAPRPFDPTDRFAVPQPEHAAEHAAPDAAASTGFSAWGKEALRSLMEELTPSPSAPERLPDAPHP